MSGDIAELDLKRLADHGIGDTVPCVTCDKPTQSHIIIYVNEWREFDGVGAVADVEPGTRVHFAIICHSCFTDDKHTHATLSELGEKEGMFAAVVG